MKEESSPTQGKTIEELLEAQDQLQLVMNNIPQFIFWKDVHSVYLGCNENFAESAGLDSPAEIIGKTDYELPWKREEADFFREVDRRVMDADQAEYHIIEPQLRADGKETWLDTNKVPLHDQEGNVIGILGTYEDITERREAEQELDRYRRHLEQLVEERTAAQLRLEGRMRRTQRLESLGALAGAVAHDFSNLLVGVIGNTEMAQLDVPEDSEAAESLRAVLDASTRAAELCKQMLACSGKGRFQTESLRLDEVLLGIEALLRSSLSKRVSLTFENLEDLPLCEADESQLRQVLLNLVLNANEAIGDDEGAVLVRTGTTYCDADRVQRSFLRDEFEEGHYVFVEVIDDGCGIDETIYEQLFDPFFTTKFTGRGLGLASVLGIVRGHGGFIEVGSRVGEGSCFRVLFPALGTVAPSESSALVQEPVSEGGLLGRTVLVVDDEAAVRKVALKILERSGCRTLVAVDGIDALERFTEYQGEIDYVVLDVTMPRMGGIETFQRLREDSADLGILMSTGYNVDDLPEELHADPRVAVLAKPYRAEELVTRLSALESAT